MPIAIWQFFKLTIWQWKENVARTKACCSWAHKVGNTNRTTKKKKTNNKRKKSTKIIQEKSYTITAGSKKRPNNKINNQQTTRRTNNKLVTFFPSFMGHNECVCFMLFHTKLLLHVDKCLSARWCARIDGQHILYTTTAMNNDDNSNNKKVI